MVVEPWVTRMSGWAACRQVCRQTHSICRANRIPALVIVTVEGEPIPKSAQRIAQGITTTFETRQWVSILLVMPHVN